MNNKLIMITLKTGKGKVSEYVCSMCNICMCAFYINVRVTKILQKITLCLDSDS